MPEETPTTDAPKVPTPNSAPGWLPKTLGTLAKGAVGTIKLEWLRHLLHNVGGRKVAVFAGTVYGALELAKSGTLVGWELATAIAGIGIAGAATVISIAWEDRAKKGAGGA